MRNATIVTAPPELQRRARNGQVEADGLLPVLEQHAISELTLLASGSRAIVHCEAERRDAIAGLLEAPETGPVLGPPPPATPAICDEIFAWESPPASERVERTALILRLQEGREPEYREWLADREVLEVLQVLWQRNRIWRHDVLLAGTDIVAFYECEDKHNVLKAFREPEALEMLLQDLSKIMVLDPYTPLVPFDEVLHCERGA